jgi:hypothetical protein
MPERSRSSAGAPEGVSEATADLEYSIRWHRAGFKLFWRWISRNDACGGRKPTSEQQRNLIFRMVAEDPTCGYPRIHGELQMLGFDISEWTVLVNSSSRLEDW